MYKDPDMMWEGEFPYDVLMPAGITPHSSMREIMGAKRYFTRHRQLGTALSAFKSLELVKERLFVDFFLYRTQPQFGLEEGERG